MTEKKEIGNLNFGMAKIGLPLLHVEKDGVGLFFLVDSGASYNFIRKDVLEYFNELSGDYIAEECQFYGIDGIEHKTSVCLFNFTLNNVQHEERFQILENGSPLDFPINETNILSVHGIVGVDFLVKFKCVIDFSTFTLMQAA